MSHEVNTEHRGRSRCRQTATLSGLTSTGRLRKGTRGKLEHGCVFCGKVYTRREHLRRHQRKHKRGAYPCNAPGCTCTFHNPALLERHRRHDWCSPFELPEIYLFRCPSRPELVLRSEAVGGRSTSATPVSPSDDGIASSSPVSAHADFASNPEGTLDIISFPPRSQYLQVPHWNDPHNRHGGGYSHRPMARSGYSSPAVMQSTQNNCIPSILPSHPNPIPEYPPHYIFDGYVPGTDSATGLNLPAQDGHTVQGHHPMLRHSTSLFDEHTMSNLPQSYLFPLLPGQHAEPRYSDSIPTEIESSSANTYFPASLLVGIEYDHNTLRSFGLPDQSFHSYGAVFQDARQPIIVSLDYQEQMPSAEHSSSSEGAHLQSIHRMTRTNSSRSHSTGNLDLQYMARFCGEQR